MGLECVCNVQVRSLSIISAIFRNMYLSHLKQDNMTENIKEYCRFLLCEKAGLFSSITLVA